MQFLNKALTEAPIVAMIFPNTFNRYSIHCKVKENARLIYSKLLPDNSFILNNREFKVKTVFQIGTLPNVKTYSTNQRLITKQETRHPEFKTGIHNNTKQTIKYFDKEKYKWDFAVVRQGYYNYNEIISDPSRLVKNRQYFFVKANDKKVLKRIREINFQKLSESNTQIPGFSTTDFVKAYKETWG